MDSARIQWALKYANNIQRQQLEDLISRLNLVLDAIPPLQQCEQQNGSEALNVSSVESSTSTIDDCYWNTEARTTVNEFNWLQQQHQTGYERVESAVAIKENNNNKIVSDCFINTGHTKSELSALLKQSGEVVSQSKQQSEFSSNVASNESNCLQQLEQETGFHSLAGSDIRKADNKIVGDCCSSFGYTETDYQSLVEPYIEQNDNNTIVGDCFIRTGHTESELSAKLKQPDHVLSPLSQSQCIIPTPITSQQGEIAVSDYHELQPLHCEFPSCASNWLQQLEQETGFHSLVESDIRKNDNKIVGDCCSNSTPRGYQSLAKLDNGQNDKKILGDCCSNVGCTETASKTHKSSPLINYLYYLYERPLPPVTEATTLNDFNWLKQQQQTSYEHVEPAVVIGENNNNKIVGDCFKNAGLSETELSAVLKQPDRVVSQLLPTPIINQQSEITVSDFYELQPLNCELSSCATESNWLQQEHKEISYHSLVASDFRKNDKTILSDCCSNFGCTETASKTHEWSHLLKQPDQVVSQLSQSQCITPTPIISQQSEIAVSDDCDQRPLQCAISSSDDTEHLQVKSQMKDINGDNGVTADESLKELQLTQISQSNNYHDQNNFLYTRKITRSLTNTYFRCKNRVRYGCPASAVAKNNDLANAVLHTKHNHKSSIKKLDNEKFDKEMDKVFKENELETPLKVYLKTKRNLIDEIDTANVPPPKSKESFVRRRKIKKVPTLPKTILDFIEIMSKAQYKHFTENVRKSTFYRGVWEDDDGNSNIMFISQDALDTLNTMDNITLLMDGTFKVLPRHFRRRFRQLYIISFIYKGRSYPLAYSLMQKKDFKSYDLIFGRIKLLIPNVTVIGCMSDYEAATRKALMKHFPTARISGCFFHYVQAMHKKFKKYGMLKDEKFQTVLQEVSALALLPNNYVIPGFNYINEKMKNLRSVRWEKFSSYWKNTWPKAHISVYELTDRTNNFSESLNNTINSLNGPRPTIWKLISNLKLIEMQRADELKNHVHGLIPKKPKSEEIKFLDAKIKAATKIFNEDRDIESFLRSVTFQEEFESYFKVRIFIAGVDEDDDDDDDDCNESDDEIIPNWFNEKMNLGNAKRKIALEDVNIVKKPRVALLI